MTGRGPMILRMLLTIGALALFSGCRSYTHYNYKRVDLEFWRGNLEIVMLTTSKDYTEKGLRYQVSGNPYSLVFWYGFPPSARADRLEIIDAVLTGVNSGNRIQLGRTNWSSKPYNRSRSGMARKGLEMHMGTSFSDLRTQPLAFEPYVLTCIARLYVDGRILEEKRIEVRLDTDLRKGRRSDIYDALMGI
jgi:hypothetical protein